MYCQQPLGTAAVQLIQKYREFCNNQLKADVDDAARGLQNTSKELLSLDLRGLQEQLARRDKSANESGNARPIYKAIADVLRHAEVLQGAANRQERLPEDDVRQGAEKVSTAVKQDIRETSILLQNLRKESEDRQKALAIEVTKLRDLESRILLRELLPEIKSFVSRAQWASRATIIEFRFPAITRSLTEASKIASDTLLNHNFDGFFQE